MSADLILHYATIRTLDPGQPTATAVAIEDGVLTAVGSDGDVRSELGPGTEVVDGRDLAIVPGLTVVDGRVDYRA